jgi:glutaredoxin
MRTVIRLLFRTVRLLLGPFVLLLEWLQAPKGINRTPEAQRAVDAETRKLDLYQFRTCPFCVKVRQEVRRLSLDIDTRDAQRPGEHRDALLVGGGEVKVPCLRIAGDDGSDRWLYESDAIIAFLRSRFAEA